MAAQGKENAEVNCNINSFALGVESVNPDARVYVRVVHNWFDPMGEEAAANDLIARGCDVIAQDTDTAAPQVTAAKAGVWSIGYNSDMSVNAPEAVITSVIFRWEVYYTALVRSVTNGPFTTAPYIGSLVDGMVDLAPLAEHLAAPGTAERIAGVREQMIKGGFNVFDGVLKTNDGKTVGEEGKTLLDDVIFYGIHWYYRNVVEVGP